jgi:hypothetical protein
MSRALLLAPLAALALGCGHYGPPERGPQPGDDKAAPPAGAPNERCPTGNCPDERGQAP